MGGAVDDTSSTTVVVIGAGPAGLTAAWELNRGGRQVTVLEADAHYVGGIARTVEVGGYRFDIGGHRFFSKSQTVLDLWRRMLPEEAWMRAVPRLSRIYYRGKFFDYPLDARNALRNLGVLEATRCVGSYVWAKIRPPRKIESFEDWVSSRFGRRLFEIFFRSYTEKVWGMRCDEISADWAAQRIKGLSLRSAVMNALGFGRGKSNGKTIKTLIDEFAYPRLGPGMLWEEVARTLRSAGHHVLMDHRVARLELGQNGLVAVHTHRGERFVADQFISTMPIRSLVTAFGPVVPIEVLNAAQSLRYRDFLTVAVVIEKSDLFPDTWIYIHDPAVRVGRIQNFGNWSAAMVPSAGCSSLGLEYFCNEGDDVWSMDDQALGELAVEELRQIGLIGGEAVRQTAVVRMRKAYPVYDDDYQQNVQTVRDWISQVAPNVQLVGRNGMHMYNNQDHSMLAAYLAARNILGESWDPWLVNADAEYHEDGHSDQAGRLVPRPIAKN